MIRQQKLKTFLGLASFEMLAMFRRGLFYAYLSIYLRHFLGLSVTETTLFATFPMLLNIAFQTFVWGRISDRLQLRRTLILTGELLAAAGTLLVWYIHTLPDNPLSAGYCIILGLTGVEIFWSMSNVGWTALVSDLYDAPLRGGIQGRLASMGGIGRILGIWIGGLLYDAFGLRYNGWGFEHGALFFVASGVMVLSTLPLSFLPEGGIRPATASSDAAPPVVVRNRRNPSRRNLFAVFLIGMIFINFGRNAIAIVFPQYLSLENGLAIDSRTLSYIINTQSLSIVFLGWGAGWIGRRFGDGQALLAGCLCALAGLITLSLWTSLPVLYLSSFLRGMGDVIILSNAYALASVLIPERVRARGFAWFNATFFLSWGLGATVIVGPIVDYIISAGQSHALAYRISFAAAAVVTTIGVLIVAGLVFSQARRSDKVLTAPSGSA